MNWKMVRALAGAILLVLLPTVSRAVPPAPEFFADLPLQPANSCLPPGYEGALDHLRPLYPIRQPPLADPVGLAVNATGTRVYVIEKGLHRLSRIDVAPASATYGAITPITDALNDPQMAVALSTAETVAFVVENAPGTLKRVTLSSGQVTTVTAGLAYPLDLALSPDETTAYVTQFDGVLAAVDLGSGAVTTVTTGLEYPGGIVLSADGKTAYVAEYREGPLRQINLTTGAIGDLGTGALRPSYDIAVDTAAGYAYVGDKKFHLWRVNLDDGDTEMLIPNTYERNEALALSPDGATLYAGQRGAGRLLAIDLATRQARPVFPLLQGPSGTALNRAGTQLYVLEGDSGELSVQDVDPASPTFGTLETVATGVVPAGTAIFPAPINLAVNPAETWALVPYDHDLRRVDLLSGAVSTVVSGAFDGASGVALDGSGTVAYVSDWSDVSAVDTTTWAVTPVASTLGLPHLHTIALSPDGAFIYGVRLVYDDYDQPRMSRVRISDGQTTHLVTGVTMPLGLALTPDGRQAIVPDYARGGRLLSVALDSGATTLLADLGWEPGSATVGPDGTLYLTRPNWLYDEFVWEGIVYGFRPGAWWRLEVKSSPALYQPTGQAISADGKWLYLLTNNGLHRVNLAVGAGHGQVTPIADDVLWYPHDVALTSGGAAWVVSGGELHEISLADGTLLAVVPYGAALGTGPQYGLALSPDGALAYLSTSDNRLVQVNLNTGAVDVIATGLAAPYGVALNGAGDTLYVAEADGGRLSAVNVGTGQAVTVAAGLERPVDVALDEPSGIAIVLENRFPDYHVTRVNLASGAVTRLFSGNYGWVSGLVLTPDRSRAYLTNSFNGEVWGVDLATGQVADSLIEALSRPHGFALTGGGEGAYTTEEFVPRIRHVNLATGAVRTAVYLPGPASGLALTHDEATAYVTRMYYDDLLKVDLATGTWTTVTAGCMHGRVVLDPAEMTAYASCPSGNAVWAVALSTGARTQLMGDLPAPYALDVNRSGTRLYVTAGSVGEMGDSQLWAVDLPGGAKHLVATLEQAQDAPGDITLSPDERYVYVYDQLGSNVGAGVWRVDVDPASPTYGQVVSLARWIGELQHGEFTADGEHLVLSHANAHRMISLYLDKYHCVYLPAILRSN